MMKMILTMTLAAAAMAGLAGVGQAQVPSAESMGMGQTPRPRVEGRVHSTPRQGAITPDQLAQQPGQSGMGVPHAQRHWSRTTRMHKGERGRHYGQMGRSRQSSQMDDELETGTIVGGQGMGPSRAWKWQQCAQYYPSFDPRTGTFRGEDGRIHICQ